MAHFSEQCLAKCRGSYKSCCNFLENRNNRLLLMLKHFTKCRFGVNRGVRTCSVTRFGKIVSLWQNLLSLWCCMEGFLYLAKRWGYFSNFQKFWLANFVAINGPNIEKYFSQLVTLVRYKRMLRIWKDILSKVTLQRTFFINVLTLHIMVFINTTKTQCHKQITV